MNYLMRVAAAVCEPLGRASLAEARVDAHADETVRTQTRRERSFVRTTFLSHLHTVYLFSGSRSGDTPKVVLGGTEGALTIGRYTGYDVVTDVKGRHRTGCWSHAVGTFSMHWRRRSRLARGSIFFSTSSWSKRDAAGANIIGTAAHLELRRGGARRSWTASMSRSCPFISGARRPRHESSRSC